MKLKSIIQYSTLLVPILLFFSMILLKKPSDPYTYTIDEGAPVVFYTSLADTLPQKALDELDVASTLGIHVRYLSGHDVRYFTYETPARVPDIIASLPFHRTANLADTVSRVISYDEVEKIRHTISDTELQAASFFWNINPEEFTAFECVKGEMKHNFLIHKISNTVLHRVEYVG